MDKVIRIGFVFLCFVGRGDIFAGESDYSPNSSTSQESFFPPQSAADEGDTDSGDFDLAIETEAAIRESHNLYLLVGQDRDQRETQNQQRRLGGYRDTIIRQMNNFSDIIAQRLLDLGNSDPRFLVPLYQRYVGISYTIDRILAEPERTIFSKYSATQKQRVNELVRELWILAHRESLEDILTPPF